MEETTLHDQQLDSRVSQMAENLIGSEIIKLSTEVKSRIADGQHIYNLTIGDFDSGIFPIPEQMRDEITKAYAEGHTNYPAANGMPELREAVAAFIKRRQGLDYSPDDFLISGGARPLIYAAYCSILDPGDTVLFPIPSWNNNHYSHLMGAKTVAVSAKPENNFMPMAADLQPHLEEASILALCSPLNPTGTCFSKAQLSAICELVLAENMRRSTDEKPLYVIYDQIYWNLTYGDTEHFDPVSLFPEMKNYTIFVDGLSKAFAATGVRVGWGFGPTKVIGKMKAILSHLGAWSPKAEQIGVSRFLRDESRTDAFINHMRSELQTRLVGFYEGICELREAGFAIDAISPQAALYLTVKVDLVGKTTANGKLLANMAEVTSYLIEEAGIALVPFYCFNVSRDSSWFRLSVGTIEKESIPKALQSLRSALEKLS